MCWEVLLPEDNEGNLAAQIIGTPPDDMYGLASADVPSAGTLELFGTHDAMGRISSLEGFAYSDPDGWRTRVAFVDSLDDSPILVERTGPQAAEEVFVRRVPAQYGFGQSPGVVYNGGRGLCSVFEP
ncbi:MAG: hypothetical protein IH897_06615 [Planctomycetes bacterium]|nr:hypothetical protein [Planctomycetota bacterium]